VIVAPAPEAVTVIPEPTTSIEVTAVPTILPSSLISTPLPPPPPPVELIVTSPVEPEIVMLVPATIEVTIPVRLVPEPENEVAVTTPSTVSFDVGFVVPIPILPVGPE
jgi:hypothetical protein